MAAAELLEHAGENGLDRRPHVLLGDEGHLEVELVELAGRAVGASVLVPEAGRDLEVAVEPRHHQQLLELLRGLRQRVEHAGMDAARHEVVARALGRAGGQNGRLELREPGGDHPSADRGDHVAPQHDVPVERLAPEVEEAIAQPRLLRVLGVARDLERKRLRHGLDRELGNLELDLPGGELRVDRVGRARYDRAGDRDHALELECRGGREGRAAAGEHALRDPVVVPEVDEEEVPVVALPVDPAREPRGAPRVLGPQLAAGVGPAAMHRPASRPAPAPRAA